MFSLDIVAALSEPPSLRPLYYVKIILCVRAFFSQHDRSPFSRVTVCAEDFYLMPAAAACQTKSRNLRVVSVKLVFFYVYFYAQGQSLK